MRTFAEQIIHEREKRNETPFTFAKTIGVSKDSIANWEDGKGAGINSIAKIAEALEWDGQTYQKYVDEMRVRRKAKKIPALTQEVFVKAEKIGITRGDIGLVLGFTKNTVYGWRRRIPEGHKPLLRGFLRMSEETVRKTMILQREAIANRPTRMKRHTLDAKCHELMYRIEEKYGSLPNCPEDDEMLRELRTRLGVRYYVH